MKILGIFQRLLFSSSGIPGLLAALPIPSDALIKIYNFLSKGFGGAANTTRALPSRNTLEVNF